MELVSSHSLGTGKIVHKRTRDTDNFFQYNAPYLSINLSNSSKIHPFISLNKLNFFSIFYKQHGFRDKKKNLYDFAKNIAVNYLELLADNIDLRRKIGREAFKRQRKLFSKKLMISSYIDLYNNKI